MSFCGPLGMHVILRPAGNACHFAARWECMSFCGPLLVKNSFCGPLLVNVILLIAKIDNELFLGMRPPSRVLRTFCPLPINPLS
jgi:hypothetical protein